MYLLYFTFVELAFDEQIIYDVIAISIRAPARPYRHRFTSAFSHISQCLFLPHRTLTIILFAIAISSPSLLAAIISIYVSLFLTKPDYIRTKSNSSIITYASFIYRDKQKRDRQPASILRFCHLHGDARQDDIISQ